METDKEILERLKRISIDIKIIKENMPDKEIFLNNKNRVILWLYAYGSLRFTSKITKDLRNQELPFIFTYHA